MARSRFVVVGGGITGLAAAWELSQLLPEAQVTLLDAADRPGGKLRREPVAGVPLDVGAESLLARRPEALALAREIGLANEVVHPATTSASIWSRSQLYPMPTGTLVGIPSPPSSALGILTADEVERAAAEDTAEPVVGEDVSLGGFVADRLGDAVVDRLVEPLLGGVYAGRSRSLSLRACLPQVFDGVRRGVSLTTLARASAEASAQSRAEGTPVFAGVDGGVGRLAEVLTERLRAGGVVVHSRTIARELRRTESGWSVVVGPRPAPQVFAADAVLLAVPAAPAARLLAPHHQDTAAALAEIEYASMAIVTLAVAAEDGFTLPGSGFLVPPVDGRTIKASTFTSSKWAWAERSGEGLAFLRASVGRARETFNLQRPDQELVQVAVSEVSEALGHPLPRLVDSHVQRWGGALPQYTVGHADRVSRIRAGTQGLPGLELAGAAYEGVGVPACIAGGRSAAQALATHLRARRGEGRE
jgi:protoporphyrinogen/coproporphyrinogen III oxidase